MQKQRIKKAVQSKSHWQLWKCLYNQQFPLGPLKWHHLWSWGWSVVRGLCTLVDVPSGRRGRYRSRRWIGCKTLKWSALEAVTDSTEKSKTWWRQWWRWWWRWRWRWGGNGGKAPVKKSAFDTIAKKDKNQTRMGKDLRPSTPRWKGKWKKKILQSTGKNS